MAKLDRAGVKIHYEVHGSGPTLLLSHGYSSTCRMWDGQIAALKDRYQVVVWDMRGHGDSDYPADPDLYSAALTVGDMAALLDVVGARTAIVAGLSLGGYMSLAFHAAHPDRVRALMLFDTGPASRTTRHAPNGTRPRTSGQPTSRPAGWRPSIPATRSSSRATAMPKASPALRAACWPSRTTG